MATVFGVKRFLIGKCIIDIFRVFSSLSVVINFSLLPFFIIIIFLYYSRIFFRSAILVSVWCICVSAIKLVSLIDQLNFAVFGHPHIDFL